MEYIYIYTHIYIYIYLQKYDPGAAGPPPPPQWFPRPLQSGSGCSYGFIPALCGCGGGNAFIPPCGVAVVVVMLSSTPCGVAAGVVMVSSTPWGVAVVLVVMVVVIVVRLHCHVEVWGARLTSTKSWV